MRNGIVALSGHARVKRGETTIVPLEQPLHGARCNDTASRKAPRNGKNEALGVCVCVLGLATGGAHLLEVPGLRSQCVSGAQRQTQILRSFSGGGSGAHCRSVHYYRGGFIGFWNNTRVWRLVGPCSYAYGSRTRANASGVKLRARRPQQMRLQVRFEVC